MIEIKRHYPPGTPLHQFLTACERLDKVVWAYIPVLGPDPTRYPIKWGCEDLAYFLNRVLRVYELRGSLGMKDPADIIVLVPPITGTVKWAELLTDGPKQNIHMVEITEGAP